MFVRHRNQQELGSLFGVRQGNDVVVGGAVDSPKAEQSVTTSVWVPSVAPELCELNAQVPNGIVRWFDISPGVPLEEVWALLEPRCDGLEPAMLQDLLVLDDLPQGERWGDGSMRLASTFAIYPEGGEHGSDWTVHPPSPNAVYQPVELLAGDDWLVTKWHDPCLYCGSRLVKPISGPVGKKRIIGPLTERWPDCGNLRAGDLGIMVMYELALTYAPAYRSFRAALEEWEMNLYGFGEENSDKPFDPERELRDLWGARARFRDWLSPLNVSGLNGELNNAWLPATEHKKVKEADKHIDMTLHGLRQLGDTLRSSFQLLHIQKAEAQREHRERLQRRIEKIATIFLVPTLVVGFFGANTWVPGEHERAGLEGMVAAIVVATAIVMFVLWLTNKRHETEHVNWYRKG